MKWNCFWWGKGISCLFGCYFLSCTPSYMVCLLRVCVLCVRVCVCMWLWASSFPFIPFSLSHRVLLGQPLVVLAASQRPSMPALREPPRTGKQHKIRIIAVDYGTQWAAASERFIHPGKRDCGGGKRKGSLGPSAALPRWAQAWHQWPERTGILDMPTALPLSLCPYTPSHLNPLPSFLALASLDAAFCQASWGHCHCLRVKQSPSEGRERKQSASHGTSQEQGWLPQPTPHRPLFWLRGSGVTPLPPSPLVSLLHPPCNPFFSLLVPHSHPENPPLSLREPFQ